MLKPIILAVETDQSVAEALERDLPRRYSADYDIVVERSPTTGLDRLRERYSQGGEVALLLAGLWMAEMGGIEFLVQAHALAPDAKRLLLIAFADPAANEVAADATALGQFDSFVTKPWASPEEWLYPETSSAEPWAGLRGAFLPPKNGLWRFGGEMYARRCASRWPARPARTVPPRSA